MAFLSFLGNQKEEVVLLVDIGNGTITAAFAGFKKGSKPRFIHSTKTSFPIMESPESAELIVSMNTGLESVLSILTKEGLTSKSWGNIPKKISKALVTFSSPWFILNTKHLHLAQENMFVITKSFLDDVVSKEEKIFEQELIKTNPGIKPDSFEIIEKSVVHSKINGYTVESSLGKKTKVFDAFLCMSIVGKGALDNVRNTLLHHFHVPKEKILVHTFPLVSFSVVRDMYLEVFDFLLMDITSEVTDISLVQNGVITKLGSFPSGRNFLIRQIIKTFNASPEIAESTLHLYTDKKLDDENTRLMEEVLINTEKEWSIYLENSLTDLSADMSLPSHVYITADPDVTSIYNDFLKLQKTDATAYFRQNAQIVPIDTELLKNLYTLVPGTRVDPFIALLSIFYSKFL